MRRARIKAIASVPVRRKLAVNNNPVPQSIPDDTKTDIINIPETLKTGSDDFKVDPETVSNEAPVNDTSLLSSTVNTAPEQIVDPPKSLLVTTTETIGLPVEGVVIDPPKPSLITTTEATVLPVEETISDTPKPSLIKTTEAIVLPIEETICDISKHPVTTTTEAIVLPIEEKIINTPKSAETVVEELSILSSQSPVKENIFETPKSPVKEFKESSKSSPVKSIEPPSPVKFGTNRIGFARPTPRLDGHSRIRRNSVQGSGASASESEDDSRRQNSNTQNNNTNGDCTNQIDKSSINNENNKSKSCYNKKGNKKKKMVVSDSVRRLMESRREFNRSHSDKNPPDKSKLKMYDLIYYNPSTNPMKKKTPIREHENETLQDNENEADAEDENEENVDNPEPQETQAPQVKVGPNGELIIDDQSLIIKTNDIEKERARLSRKRALVDDESRITGFYKRRKKSKDWLKEDTIKFYKALSTLGTDFLLMKSFFPDRTRENIKMKFKKEEKQHPLLIEKALSSTRDFDLDKLKKDFEECDKELQLQKDELLKLKEQNKINKKGKKKYKSIARSAIPDIDDDEDEHDNNNEEEKDNNTNNNNEEIENVKKKDIKLVNNKRKYKRIIKPKDSDDEDNDNDNNNNNKKVNNKKNKNATGVNKEKKTRKKTLTSTKKITSNCRTILDEIFDKDDNNVDENSKEQITSIDNIQETVPDIQNVEPGSFVVLTKDCPIEPGKKLLEVYMVSDAEMQSDCDQIDESQILSLTNNNIIIEETLPDNDVTSG